MILKGWNQVTWTWLQGVEGEQTILTPQIVMGPALSILLF